MPKDKDEGNDKDASPDAAQKDDPEPEKDEPKDDTPTTVRVDGVFEATEQAEISVDSEQVSSWEIKKLADHGSTITEGQNVVVFETEDIDKQLKKAETDLRLATLSLEDDEFAHDQFLETQKLDRQAAERTRKNAKQDYDNFVQVDRDREVLSAKFNLKSWLSSLENAQEELEQLEQMYLEDDLTEASEEIVLKRAEQAVESAQFRFDSAEISSERAISQTLPQSIANAEQTLAKAELAYEKAIRDLDSARKRRDIELQTKRDALKEQSDKRDELKQERKRIAITAPLSGIVLHGELTRGRLSEKPSQLEEGSKVTPKQVIATIADPQNLRIRLTLDEAKLYLVKPEKTCKITCEAFPDFTASGTVKSVSEVGYAAGKFDAVVEFKLPKDSPALMPTMNCHLDFEVAKKTEKDAENAKDE